MDLVHSRRTLVSTKMISLHRILQSALPCSHDSIYRLAMSIHVEHREEEPVQTQEGCPFHM